jgi:hypothetical protein
VIVVAAAAFVANGEQHATAGEQQVGATGRQQLALTGWHVIGLQQLLANTAAGTDKVTPAMKHQTQDFMFDSPPFDGDGLFERGGLRATMMQAPARRSKRVSPQSGNALEKRWRSVGEQGAAPALLKVLPVEKSRRAAYNGYNGGGRSIVNVCFPEGFSCSAGCDY